jgi:hypothetical protein
MRVNILYDDRRPEYLPLIMDEVIRQGIDNYEFVTPIPDDNVVKSINISQKSIIKKAKERGDKEVCIMEHDIWFPNKDGWKYFLSNKPDLFDIYIGGTYLIDNKINYIPPHVKVNSYIGHHCIIVNETYYDKFLETDETKHIDTEQEGRGNFYVCFPFAALQRPGYSFNNKDKVDYNTMLRPEYIYR